ncbi:hypothetical protein ACFPVX_11645 [Cohnella faecalis]|uniref:Uncharacterized protein n=1 Tax=Cohnella faecalis TaxID=2315694 RepID=A0A398CM42_9BACL|nr:hypothetical protein [Cohnella faecalis]RIE03713.1 hypothetical protein D3H35_10480 [Cohnella faecalis]
MNVFWMLPDTTVHKQEVADIEQLMFLMRMVTTTSIKGRAYRISDTELLVDSDRISIVVTLVNAEA